MRGDILFAKTAAHVGFDRTWDKIVERYYWPHMLHYVKNYIDACEACQNRQITNVPSTGYLQQILKYNLLDCWSFDHL